MGTPADVANLIDRFHSHLSSYRSGRYNETQVRREFIDPFFEALGWDIANKGNSPEAYKDVIHEDLLKVAGDRQAPDYSFRIGGDRKFFVEAKKPSVNLKDNTSPAFQLRRYAWSANLPLSILTDFDEFVVYDCRIIPNKGDKTSTARILYYDYTQYADQWDEIATIFSREAVLAGSLEQYTEKLKDKKGVATVDAAFLREIEIWRELLAKNIAVRNPGLTQRELNFAVQMTLDRIIFLRISEDRGIESYERLKATLGSKQVYKELCNLFYLADGRYNSGLFHFQKEKGRPEHPDDLTLNLTIDNEPLQKIIGSTYYPDSPYEFSVLPIEILGQVYEQFLGKVIHLTADHQAVVEEKPEVRKAGGVYYTPDYIVNYIVRHTVGKLVEDKTPRQVTNLRILDPACGSGSFLIGAYQFLLDWHRDWYVEDGVQKHKKVLYQGPGGDWRLTSAERKRILLNNIYGVDIDSQAVEVTKLSLLLKVLEGESEQSLVQQLQMFHERALPDLGNNIKCGNSLIGPDFYQDQQISFLDEEERYRVNVFDWESEFQKIMREGKFDAIIGNPPYIRIQRIDHKQSDYFYKNYKTPTSKTDISLLFLEKSLDLASKNGLIGFICTSQWLATDYGKNLRTMLSDGRLHEAVDFGSLPVFKNADTYPAIFILSPTPSKELKVKRIAHEEHLNITDIEQAQNSHIPLDSLTEAPWNLSALDITSVLKQRNIQWKPLKHFGKAYYSIITGSDPAFIVSEEVVQQLNLERDILHPFAYRGNEIERYKIVQPKARVIYPYSEGDGGAPILLSETELRTRYPNIYTHLLAHKDSLQKRMDSRKYYALGENWYCHVRPGNFHHIHSKKLLFKGIDTRSSVGLLAEGNAFSGANCPGIILETLGEHSLYYILGLLNSKVIAYHLRKVCPAKLGGYTRFNSSNITETPIRLIEFSNTAVKAGTIRLLSLLDSSFRSMNRRVEQ